MRHTEAKNLHGPAPGEEGPGVSSGHTRNRTHLLSGPEAGRYPPHQVNIGLGLSPAPVSLLKGLLGACLLELDLLTVCQVQSQFFLIPAGVERQGFWY